MLDLMNIIGAPFDSNEGTVGQNNQETEELGHSLIHSLAPLTHSLAGGTMND